MLPHVSIGLGLSSMILGGNCVLCRVCPLVHKRVVLGSESVAIRGVGLMSMVLFSCGLSCSLPFEYVIEAEIRVSGGVSSIGSGVLSG